DEDQDGKLAEEPELALLLWRLRAVGGGRLGCHRRGAADRAEVLGRFGLRWRFRFGGLGGGLLRRLGRTGRAERHLDLPLALGRGLLRLLGLRLGPGLGFGPLLRLRCRRRRSLDLLGWFLVLEP